MVQTKMFSPLDPLCHRLWPPKKSHQFQPRFDNCVLEPGGLLLLVIDCNNKGSCPKKMPKIDTLNALGLFRLFHLFRLFLSFCSSVRYPLYIIRIGTLPQSCILLAERSQSVTNWRSLEVDSDQSKACLNDLRGFVGWRVIIGHRNSKSNFGANNERDILRFVFKTLIGMFPRAWIELVIRQNYFLALQLNSSQYLRPSKTEFCFPLLGNGHRYCLIPVFSLFQGQCFFLLRKCLLKWIYVFQTYKANILCLRKSTFFTTEFLKSKSNYGGWFKQVIKILPELEPR